MMITAALFASCNASATKQEGESKATSEVSTNDGIVKLYSFHTNQRCITCKAIERLTREVVAEMANDKIVLEVVNISDKRNEELADKYEVTWSSLIADKGERYDLTKLGFSYAKNQPEVFKTKLKEALTTMLH